jgi:hypothetical protein
VPRFDQHYHQPFAQSMTLQAGRGEDALHRPSRPPHSGRWHGPAATMMHLSGAAGPSKIVQTPERPLLSDFPSPGTVKTLQFKETMVFFTSNHKQSVFFVHEQVKRATNTYTWKWAAATSHRGTAPLNRPTKRWSGRKERRLWRFLIGEVRCTFNHQVTQVKREILLQPPDWVRIAPTALKAAATAAPTAGFSPSPVRATDTTTGAESDPALCSLKVAQAAVDVKESPTFDSHHRQCVGISVKCHNIIITDKYSN